jgi:hypothetical protein
MMMIATADAGSLWIKGTFAFATECVPSSYENFSLSEEWCEQFASALIPNGQHIQIELPAESHGDFVWTKTFTRDEDSFGLVTSWILLKHKDNVLVDNIMTIADWVNSLSLHVDAPGHATHEEPNE